MIYGFMWKKIFVPGNGDRGEGGGEAGAPLFPFLVTMYHLGVFI